MSIASTEAAADTHPGDETLERLRAASSNPELSDETRAIARAWMDVLEASQAFLARRDHPIVFLGGVGAGKSSIIGALSGLMIDPQPPDANALVEACVLPSGAGRTTVCEVQITVSEPPTEQGFSLSLAPRPQAQVAREIRLFAEDEWELRQGDRTRRRDEDSDPRGQELRRLILNLIGCPESRQTWMEGGLKRTKILRPLDEVISNHASLSTFGEHLVARAALATRDRTSWSWSESGRAQLVALKATLERINTGEDPGATLPDLLTITTPPRLGRLRELDDGAVPRWVDTRGYDVGDRVEARADLQRWFQDPRAVFVVCAPFADAPGDAPLRLLRALSEDALSRTLLVLVDRGQAALVPGAERDREFGQQLKVEECRRALELAGLGAKLEESAVLAIDLLQDGTDALEAALASRLNRLRQEGQRRLRDHVRDAEAFLAEDPDLAGLRAEVDEALKTTYAAHLPKGAPLQDPLVGIIDEIRATRWASRVYASCRRKGQYTHLDLRSAVEFRALMALDTWSEDIVGAAWSRLSELRRVGRLGAVAHHVDLRARQIDIGLTQTVGDYGERVTEEVWGALSQDDDLWRECVAEWSRGKGFKERVISRLLAWGKSQNFTAHERTSLKFALPLLDQVMVPTSSPQFTFEVHNLRALRRVEWTPTPLCAVVGANGAGKTTLLRALRLLGLAYERGLPAAVQLLLGGSHNLKTWGVDTNEPISLSVALGDTRWTVTLAPQEGTVSFLARERLESRGQEIFVRDGLGGMVLRGTPMGADERLGVRALMDRDTAEPAVREIAAFFQRITYHADPDLHTLREGSRSTDDGPLHSRGTNALTLLRAWSQDPPQHPRFTFVLETLQAAFPGMIEDIGFVEAGGTLVARFYRPGREQPGPLVDEANGVLQLLVLATALAEAEDGGVVLIDEPENGLHPWAIRRFLRRAARWAQHHNLTVVLSTHSTVLLDELTDQPERVFVMKGDGGSMALPVPLLSLKPADWLTSFKIGDLYEQGEIGSNEDRA